tara:strand:- start:228 stop:1193 length:966 start_codon:yes stop_codon:yes gene_type:complete
MNKVKCFFLWLLVPREIILRQRDKIYNLKLSTKIQGIALSFLLIVTGWFVYSSMFFVKFEQLISLKNQTISELNDNLLIAKEDQQKLGTLKEKYDTTLKAFLKNTENSLENLEKLIVSTGLSPDELIRRSIREVPTGGPFIPDISEEKNSLFKFKIKPNLEKSNSNKVNNNIKRLEALQNIMPSIPLAAPLDYYWVSSNYGKRKDPINGRNALHYGIDLIAQTSTKIMATTSGIVTFSGTRSKYGKMIEIDHGYGIKTRYGHLHKITKKKGEVVAFREEIGKLGSSGRATGPHLHYEVIYDYRALNPAKFINAGKNVFKKR